jgi:hypothetical protein
VCVVLNPNCTMSEKEIWHHLLQRWSDMIMCPLEDADSRASTNHDGHHGQNSDDDSSDEDENEPGRWQHCSVHSKPRLTNAVA